MNEPYGVAINDAGSLYVTNAGGSLQSISIFNSAGGYQFSWTTPSAPGGLAVVPVPEPSTLGLAAIACVSCSLNAQRTLRRHA